MPIYRCTAQYSKAVDLDFFLWSTTVYLITLELWENLMENSIGVLVVGRKQNV